MPPSTALALAMPLACLKVRYIRSWSRVRWAPLFCASSMALIRSSIFFFVLRAEPSWMPPPMAFIPPLAMPKPGMTCWPMGPTISVAAEP